MTERWGQQRWLKQCKAVDAETGKRCTRLEHVGEHSASGVAFRNPLAPGALPRRALDEYANSQREARIETLTGLGAGDARWSVPERRRRTSTPRFFAPTPEEVLP